jgi:hypothetical protein
MLEEINYVFKTDFVLSIVVIVKGCSLRAKFIKGV